MLILVYDMDETTTKSILSDLNLKGKMLSSGIQTNNRATLMTEDEGKFCSSPLSNFALLERDSVTSLLDNKNRYSINESQIEL